MTPLLLIGIIAVVAIVGGLLVVRHSYDGEEVVGAVLLMSGVLVLFIVSLIGISGAAERRACERTGREAGVETKWGYDNDCRLELRDGTFVPEANWRVQEGR